MLAAPVERTERISRHREWQDIRCVHVAGRNYYEEHPIIWLITPAKVYKIVLFSGHHTSSTSSMYDIITHPGAEMDALLSEALDKSEFKADVTLNRRARYMMLSTCAYLFDGDRYVLHGYLVTVTGKQKTK